MARLSQAISFGTSPRYIHSYPLTREPPEFRSMFGAARIGIRFNRAQEDPRGKAWIFWFHVDEQFCGECSPNPLFTFWSWN